ncbi:hypothetical protein PCAR4_690018 [Paraburkholderia caribensis]|nr:hypothetical protein PCAR4_690018 [Paraburkholderia caribensis]
MPYVLRDMDEKPWLTLLAGEATVDRQAGLFKAGAATKKHHSRNRRELPKAHRHLPYLCSRRQTGRLHGHPVAFLRALLNVCGLLCWDTMVQNPRGFLLELLNNQS